MALDPPVDKFIGGKDIVEKAHVVVNISHRAQGFSNVHVARTGLIVVTASHSVMKSTEYQCSQDSNAWLTTVSRGLAYV